MAHKQLNVDIDKVQSYLYNRFNDNTWQNKLRMFILSSEFRSILESLVSEVENDRRFTPQVKDVFNGIIQCPYEDLKLVVIGQDPYPQIGVADGIAFSCSKGPGIQHSLRMINQAIKDDFPDYQDKTDLSVWSQQGILMLNTAFTTEIGKPGTHYAIWEPFMSYLLDHIANAKPNLVYLFLGKKAQEWADSVGDDAIKIMTSHPASAAYTGNKWNHNNVFLKASEAVKERFDYTIKW